MNKVIRNEIGFCKGDKIRKKKKKDTKEKYYTTHSMSHLTWFSKKCM